MPYFIVLMLTHWATLGLLILGVFSIFNAFVATIRGAEKTDALDGYINTHWITSVILFAGISRFQTEERSLAGKVFSLIANLVSICVCLCAIGADIWNILFIHSTKVDINRTLAYHILTYNIVDIILCTVATSLGIFIVVSDLRSEQDAIRQAYSFRIFGFGVALTSISTFRFFCYFAELFIISHKDKFRRLFSNYTLDEPTWILVSITVGCLNMMSASGSYFLLITSLSFTAASIMSLIFYLWLDYRWLSLAQLSVAESHSQITTLTYLNLMLSFAHIICLLLTMMYLTSQLSISIDQINIDTRRQMMFFGLFLFILSLITLFIDYYAVWTKLFYRLFHTSEQKTFFLVILASVFTIMSRNSNLSSLALPASLVLCLYSLNSTVFELSSYFYLTYNGYFGEQLCDSNSTQCSRAVTKTGSIIHSAEMLVYLTVLVTCFVLSIIIIRTTKIKPKPHDLPSVEAKRLENLIWLLGIIMVLCALCLVVSIVIFNQIDKNSHPLMILYSVVYHISLATGLIVFPIYQIIISKKMGGFPLSILSLLAISVARFGDILSQLDYRSTGTELPIPWKIHHTVDGITLICHFYTIIITVRMIGSYPTILPCSDSVPLQLNNPAMEMTEDSNENLNFQAQNV